MQRELSSFPLPPIHRQKLQIAGYSTVDDLTGVKPSELSKDLNVSKEEALDILNVVKSKDVNQKEDLTKGQLAFQSSGQTSKNQSGVTAYDMLLDEKYQQHITTFSEKLDDLLGGGIPLTKITEICGAPGVGKTQICLQLCVDVQIPEVFGGLGGEALYIDTEGSFLVDRLIDIVQAATVHCQRMADIDKTEGAVLAAQQLSVESFLSRVHYYRCHDYIQLIATVQLLPDILKRHPQVKLIVVDSIAFHFRHDFEDYSLRTRILNGMAQKLIKVATHNRTAVVLTNQMTTKINTEQGNSSHLIPALGESWGHASTIRMILYWKDSIRYALLYKSPSKQEATVPYQITMGGVRDHEKPQTSSENLTKRQRLDGDVT